LDIIINLYIFAENLVGEDEDPPWRLVFPAERHSHSLSLSHMEDKEELVCCYF